MRNMKNSGVEWIGEIPQEWETDRIGSKYSERKTKVNDRDYPPLSVTMKGIVPQLDTAAKSDAHDDRKLVCVGDFAINSRSDRRGSCGISKYDGSVSFINTILAPKGKMNPVYYDWLFHTTLFADEYYKWGHGIVNDLWTTNWTDMKRISIPVPPLDEQKRIADFLDGKSAEIDIVIKKTEESIEEYKKLKQSIITEAVTKGIRPGRKMKPSGIEWIGDIPEEWGVSATKNLFEFGKGLSITKADLVESGIPVISYGQIHAKYNTGVSYSEDLVKFVPESYIESSNQCLVNKYDFIFADTSEDLEGCGNCAYIDKQLTLFAGYHSIILSPKVKRSQKYLAYLFKSDTWRHQIRTGLVAVKVYSVSQKVLRRTTVILPPFEEQQEIVDFLDRKSTEIDKLIEAKQKIVEEMQTYKKSVIYEYVTGKKEVPIC